MHSGRLLKEKRLLYEILCRFLSLDILCRVIHLFVFHILLVKSGSAACARTPLHSPNQWVFSHGDSTIPNSAVGPKDIHLYRICRGSSPSPRNAGTIETIETELVNYRLCCWLVFFQLYTQPPSLSLSLCIFSNVMIMRSWSFSTKISGFPSPLLCAASAGAKRGFLRAPVLDCLSNRAGETYRKIRLHVSSVILCNSELKGTPHHYTGKGAKNTEISLLLRVMVTLSLELLLFLKGSSFRI